MEYQYSGGQGRRIAVLEEMKIKNIIKHHFILVKIAIIKKKNMLASVEPIAFCFPK